MKTKILTGIGLLSLFSGACMGDRQNVTACLVCIGIGIILVTLGIKTAKPEIK